MLRFAQFIRRTPLTHLQSSIRGPKKKKGQGASVIQSTDIINIFKQRTDPEPLDIRQYPAFVQQFGLGDHSIHELMIGVQNNITTHMPTQSTYKSFIRGLKRQKCKARNEFHHLDQKPDILNEQHDPNNRRSVYNIFVKAAEDLQAKEQQERQAAAEQEEDED